jgi:hypothetical protein
MLLKAEEVRKIDKFILKNYVITRWNSILFMIRSVLKLTPKMKSKKKQNNQTTRSYINNFFFN